MSGGGPGAGGVGDGSSTCFIATAAYGSELDPHVDALRKFRDTYMLTNAPGRLLIRVYEASSPPIARVIAEHAWLVRHDGENLDVRVRFQHRDERDPVARVSHDHQPLAHRSHHPLCAVDRAISGATISRTRRLPTPSKPILALAAGG